MRVLYFHQHFSTPRGAAGTRSYEMARALVDRGHEVTVVCGSYDEAHTGAQGPFDRGRREGTVDGIHVVEFELPYANKDGFARRAALFLRFSIRSIGVALRTPTDLVFATSTPLTVALPGIAARWLRRSPFVFEVRDLWPELPKAMGVISNPLVLGAMGVLEWVAYRSATRLVALAPGIQQGIVRRGVAEELVAMIPNGCDLDLFGPRSAGESRPDAAPPQPIRAVFAGAHGVANDLDRVLDAASELQSRSRNAVEIALVGTGRLKPSLEERSTGEGLGVAFHDPMPKEALATFLAESDVGLMVLANVPAFYNGTSPNKFFDYLASGLPIVINYPGWLADYVTATNCGIAVPPDDPGAFADALERLADDPGLRTAMGTRARELAEREFARPELAARFVQWLEESAGV